MSIDTPEDRKKYREFVEALEVAGEEGTGVIAMAMGAADPAETAAALEEQADLMRREQRMFARYLLWESTGDKRHLEFAHDILTHLRDRAPEGCRDSMIENVPLHRDIMAAWEETVKPDR